VNRPGFSWWMAVGIVLLALAVSIVVSIRRRNNKQRVQAAQQKPVWEKQRQRWAQLFYCHRCDRVFYKGDKEGLPPEQMSVLLERP
jgi:heme exporter protein D